MEKYQTTFRSATPLLMHKDNIPWSERVKAWTKDPANKAKSVAGDDRTPAWTWLGCVYHANGILVMDSDNIMAMLRDAGKKCPKPKGRGSLKSETQSGIMPEQLGWPLLNGGKQIEWGKLDALSDEEDFDAHLKAAEDLGFELLVKRAGVGNKKHIRVRPMFHEWECSGTIMVVDDTLTEAVLKTLFNTAGRFVGLGDWRPGSPYSPGKFGMFECELVKL